MCGLCLANSVDRSSVHPAWGEVSSHNSSHSLVSPYESPPDHGGAITRRQHWNSIERDFSVNITAGWRKSYSKYVVRNHIPIVGVLPLKEICKQKRKDEARTIHMMSFEQWWLPRAQRPLWLNQTPLQNILRYPSWTYQFAEPVPEHLPPYFPLNRSEPGEIAPPRRRIACSA